LQLLSSSADERTRSHQDLQVHLIFRQAMLTDLSVIRDVTACTACRAYQEAKQDSFRADWRRTCGVVSRNLWL